MNDPGVTLLFSFYSGGWPQRGLGKKLKRRDADQLIPVLDREWTRTGLVPRHKRGLERPQ